MITLRDPGVEVVEESLAALTQAGQKIRMHLPVTAASVPMVRRNIVEPLLRELGFDEETVFNIGTVVSEAADNCVKHASGGESFRLYLSLNNDHLTISFVDANEMTPEQAELFLGKREKPEEVWDETGRGMAMMRFLAEEVNVFLETQKRLRLNRLRLSLPLRSRIALTAHEAQPQIVSEHELVAV